MPFADIEPSEWMVNCCYYHSASLSQPSSFCFCPHDNLFNGLRYNLRRPTLRISVIQPLFMVEFHRNNKIFPCGRTAENPLNSLFDHTSHVLKGGHNFYNLVWYLYLLFSDTTHSYLSFFGNFILYIKKSQNP